jgi:uroporphyrin-3 C-methyltransferase/uroporphyrinogen III methyltransferase/synthase
VAEVSEQIEKDAADGKKSQRSRSGFWFGVIIILVVISIAGAGYYLLMQLRERQTNLGGEVKGELSKKIADYQSQLSAIQSQLSTIEANIAGKDTHFTKTLADFSKLHNEKLDSTRKELNESIQQLQRQLGKTRGDWLVADAEYLLSVANERLHLIGDVNTTREALEAADQRLRESGDAAVFKVREQVAKDIAALKSITVTDVVGLYVSIQTMEDQVDKLALILPYTGKEITPSTEIHNHADKTEEEHGLLDSALSKLEGVVTIRHTDQPIKEILTPEQARFIREQLRVKLEMVKLALVQQNEAIYLSSLLDAKKWTQQNFTLNNDAKKFIGELDRLNNLKIRSHFPDISQSLKMLRDITKLRIEADKAMRTPAEPLKAPITPAPVPASTAPAPAPKPAPEHP